MAKKTALFLGRFQPLHLGHLYVIKKLADKGYFVKIAIGSSEEKGTTKNPYSATVRRKMIHAALKALAIKQYKIFLVPDIPSNTRYVKHVQEIVGKFDIVEAAENPLTFKLFSKAGHKTLKRRRWRDISSTKIRGLMKKNDERWKKLVAKQVHSIAKR